MAAPHTVVRRPRASFVVTEQARPSPALLCAPLVAVLAGMAAEWLDFRALRYPLLLLVGAGVLATAWALLGRRRDRRTFALTVALGMLTWAAAETIYVVLHTLGGYAFHAERFGPQWAQALGLIAVHGLFLGAPTGLAAALLLHGRSMLAYQRNR